MDPLSSFDGLKTWWWPSGTSSERAPPRVGRALLAVAVLTVLTASGEPDTKDPGRVWASPIPAGPASCFDSFDVTADAVALSKGLPTIELEERGDTALDCVLLPLVPAAF